MAIATAPTHARTGIIGALNTEWATLGVEPAAAPDGTPWSALQPPLAGTTLAAVLASIAPLSGAAADPQLAALVTLAQDGDTRAARTLLQTMLGAVTRLARTARNRSLDDPYEAAIAAVWEELHACSPTATNIAAHLTLGALNRLERATGETPTVDDELLRHLHDEQLAGRAPRRAADPAQLVSELLSWALTLGHLNADDVALLAQLHLQEPPANYDALATRCGVSSAAMRQRRSRAVARLEVAVRNASGHGQCAAIPGGSGGVMRRLDPPQGP